MANPNEMTPTKFEVRTIPNDAEWTALKKGWALAGARGEAPFPHVALPQIDNVFSPEQPVLKCHKEAYYSIRRERPDLCEWFWRGYAAGCLVLHIKLLRHVGLRVRNIFCTHSAVSKSEEFRDAIRR